MKAKMIDKIGSIVIAMLIPQVIFFMAYFMDKFVYLEVTSPITMYKFFWVLALIGSLVCVNYSDDILPHIREDRTYEERLSIVWALAIGSVVLFILFGFGHSFLWNHANDYGIDITNIY